MKGAIRLDCGMYLPQTFTQITFTLYYIPRKAKQRQQIKKKCFILWRIWKHSNKQLTLQSSRECHTFHCRASYHPSISMHTCSKLVSNDHVLYMGMHGNPVTLDEFNYFNLLHTTLARRDTYYFLAGDRTKFPPQTFPHLMYNYWSKSPVDSLPGLPVFFNVMWEKSKNNIKRLEHAAKYPVHTRLREIAVRRGRTWNDLHAQNPGKANPVPAQAFPTLSERLN